MEQKFFAYADQNASDALDIHLGVSSIPWTGELTSAWSRFVLGIYLRHPDAMPELRVAAESMEGQRRGLSGALRSDPPAWGPSVL
jgi:hypothetical protein